MAWRSLATSNAALVDDLVGHRLLKTQSVIDVFRAAGRAWFLLCSTPDATDRDLARAGARGAYHDNPMPIGHNVTISAPHMHAMMAELLVDRFADEGPDAMRGKAVLDVGSGSGFLTVVLAQLVGSTGRVVGVEHVPQLAKGAFEVVRRRMPELMPWTSFHVGDGRNFDPSRPLAALDGQSDAMCAPPNGGQYDLIHVGAAASRDVCERLAGTLRPGGRMVIPVEQSTRAASDSTIGAAMRALLGPTVDVADHQELLVFDKDAAGKVTVRKDCDVRFVPLTALEQQIHARY